MADGSQPQSGGAGAGADAGALAGSAGAPAVPAPAPAQDAPPFFPLAGFLKEALPNAGPLPRVRVVDVGAMLLSDSEDIWRPLVRRGLCDSVVGFEPCVDECERLNASTSSTASANGSNCTFRWLPWALGDGSTGQFRRCSAPMTSSMLEPNIPLLRRFTQLEEVTTVVERSEMRTRRLDELLPELPGGRADLLKLDVQGYEHAVLQGAQRALQDVLVLHTEVEFVEMYQGQPLFAEVDQLLRKAGFVFHRFASMSGRPLKPLHFSANPLQPISQQLWADAVYVRDMWDLQRHSKEELLKAAIILHEIYHSYDVAHHVLEKYDAGLAKKYLDAMLSAK
mmetsp:Transcript_27917/g.65942  ORF Transcript_27917/g.65942 Transcript_27917/m.65942 type:complete len:338 (-) Transcript_27917:176-1189(-)